MSKACTEPINGIVKIDGKDILIKTNDDEAGLFNVMIGGTRKGFAERRFAIRSKEDFEKNKNFWTKIGI